MASLKDVYDLIHSLNKREKIQFNLYANALGGKAKESYVVDYQCFLKEKKYDKERLKTALNKEKQRKKLSESNTNLYHCILESLVSIHKNKNQKVGFLKEFQEVQILFSKGLIEQAKQKYLKLKEKQKSTSALGIGIDILEFEDSLLLRENYQDHQPRLDLINQQIIETKKVLAICQFKKMKLKLFSLANKIGTPRTAKDLDEYKALYHSEILHIDINLLPLASLPNYIVNKAILMSMIDRSIQKEGIDFLKEGLALVQQKVDIKTNFLPEYHIQRNLLSFTEQSEDVELMKESIDLFEKTMPYFNSPEHKTLSKIALCQAYLNYYKTNNSLEKAMQYIAENKTFIVDVENLKLNPHSYIIYLFCARICFLAKDYEQSLEFINLLLENKNNVRKSLHVHIYCLYLLNHYKLENWLYLPYATRALYRSILKEKKLYAPEKELISFLKKVSKGKESITIGLTELYVKFKTLEKDAFNDSFFGNGDYLLWLEAEID